MSVARKAKPVKKKEPSKPAGFPPRIDTKGVTLKGGVPKEWGKE